MAQIPSSETAGQTLATPLTIRNVSLLAAQIKELFEQDGPISLNLPDDAEADLSFVQLILAARLEAERSGRDFGLASPATGQLLSTLQRGGLLHQASPDDTAFWLHKKDPT
jgi:hypothetical protein